MIMTELSDQQIETALDNDATQLGGLFANVPGNPIEHFKIASEVYELGMKAGYALGKEAGRCELPETIWCAATKTTTVYFYSEDEARSFATASGAASGVDVLAIYINLPKSEGE